MWFIQVLTIKVDSQLDSHCQAIYECEENFVYWQLTADETLLKPLWLAVKLNEWAPGEKLK